MRLMCELAACCARASRRRRRTAPDQKAFFDLYKELVETNTVVERRQLHPGRGADRDAAEGGGLCRRRRDAVLVPEHPKDGGLVAVLKGSDATAKPMLLLGHLDVVAAKREDWMRDPFKLIEENGYYYARGTVDDKAMAASLGRRDDPLRAGGLQAEAHDQAGADLRRGDDLRVQRRRMAGEEQARPDRCRIRAQRGRRRAARRQTASARCWRCRSARRRRRTSPSSRPTPAGTARSRCPTTRSTNSPTRSKAVQGYEFPVKFTDTTRAFFGAIAPGDRRLRR